MYDYLHSAPEAALVRLDALQIRPTMHAVRGGSDLSVFTAFPTVIFTAVFGACLVWWVLTLIVAGLDADADVDLDGPDFFGFGHLPLPLGLTILSAGGLIFSLLAHIAMKAEHDAALPTGKAAAVITIGVVGGLVLVRLLSKPLGRIFVEQPAPSRTAGVGSVCKVRTLTVSETFGDAEVVTGDIRGAIVRVRAKEDRFARGDMALIIDFDESSNTYVIDDLPAELHPSK